MSRSESARCVLSQRTVDACSRLCLVFFFFARFCVSNQFRTDENSLILLSDAHVFQYNGSQLRHKSHDLTQHKFNPFSTKDDKVMLCLALTHYHCESQMPNVYVCAVSCVIQLLVYTC